MPRRCVACGHERRAELDAQLQRGGLRASLAPLVVEFGVQPDALRRHREHHLSEAEATETARHAEIDRGGEQARPEPERMNRSARAGQRRAGTADVKQHFLNAYARTGNVSQSALEAGIGRALVYTWQETDEQFVLAMREAENQAIELLEAEARTRATTGSRLVREVWRNDRLIERVVEYRPSDAVLVKLLQSLRPDKYGDKLAVTQTQIVKTMDSAAWDAV